MLHTVLCMSCILYMQFTGSVYYLQLCNIQWIQGFRKFHGQAQLSRICFYPPVKCPRMGCYRVKLHIFFFEPFFLLSYHLLPNIDWMLEPVKFWTGGTVRKSDRDTKKWLILQRNRPACQWTHMHTQLSLYGGALPSSFPSHFRGGGLGCRFYCASGPV